MAAPKKEKQVINNIDDLRAFATAKMGVDTYKDPRGQKESISTGFLTLDNMLNGGIRMGTYVELYGEQSTGKTYLALNLMREAQEKLDKPVCYMDFESAWDSERSEQIGVDLDNVDVVAPPNMELGWDFLSAAVRNDIYSVIVVDSLAGMVPAEEVEEDMEKLQVAKAARLNSKGFRVVTSGLKNTIVIFINQQRESIGVLYGDPKTTPGGKAKNYFAHMRLEVAKLKRDSEKRPVFSAKTSRFEEVDVPVGHYMKIRFIKSRMGNESKSCQLVYDYESSGVDRVEDAKAFLFEKGYIEKEGNFYIVYGHDKKINGKQNLYNFIRDNASLVDELVREAKKNDRNNNSNVETA